MCTVTYLPLSNNNFILTSNRDESPTRKTIEPREYIENNVKLLFPKDSLAGGTWIGLSEKKRLVCLLNGGFKKHKRNDSYRMSRGVVVKQLLTVDDPVLFVKEFNFEGIEPFTIILVDWNSDLCTYELVWDVGEKHFRELDQEPKIWSSSTLYDSKTKQDRREWFQNWLEENPNYTKEDILSFHHNKDLGSVTNSPIMDRLFVKTVSVSCVEKREDRVSFLHEDLSLKTITESTI